MTDSTELRKLAVLPFLIYDIPCAENAVVRNWLYRAAALVFINDLGMR